MAKKPKKSGRHRPSSASNSDADVDGWLMSTIVDKVANYCARGRAHEALSDDDLVENWVHSLRVAAHDPFNYEKRAVEGDLMAEFAVRAQEPPYHLVKDALERFTSAAADLIEKIQKDDPERFAEINRGLEADIEIFKGNRDRTQN
jgi:hypothetical protein